VSELANPSQSVSRPKARVPDVILGRPVPSVFVDVDSAGVRRAGVTALRVIGFCLLTAIAAQVRIPLPHTSIPMTLQLPAVLAAGFLLPPPTAAASMLLYLAAGAAGLPFFADAGGLTGMTGGYLVGFVIAAALVSVLRGNARTSLPRRMAAGTAGACVVFALGVGWMAFKLSDIRAAVALGLAPFYVKAVLEVALAATFAWIVRRPRELR